MTRTFDEGCLRFEFGERWQIIKYDDSPMYRKGIGRLDESKAVDFIAAHKNRTLYFVEVKDFRGCEIEQKERLRSGKLDYEVARKVRDSIAGLIGAHRNASEPESLSRYVDLLVNHDRDVKVVLWMEGPAIASLAGNDRRGRTRQERRKVGVQAFGNLLKRKLRWLTTKVALANLDEYASLLPDLAVSRLPGASPPS